MPKTQPISPELRQRIGDEIAVGGGRNEFSRRCNVSPGLVSKVARELRLKFPAARTTTQATECRRIDMAAWRLAREQQLLNEQLAALTENRQRRVAKVEKQLIDLDRFHNRQEI
jgi:hypothetical protein